MAIIELNVERPALKRTEVVGGGDDEEPGDTEQPETEVAEEAESEAEEAEETEERSGKSGGLVRRTVKRAALLGVAAVGVLTLKKARDRRKSGKDSDEE